MINKLKTIFQEWADELAEDFIQLPKSGSIREYFRISGKSKTALGVYNPDKSENIAFLTFTKHFLKNGLKVPQLYSENIDEHIYLIQNLGDTTLFSYLSELKGKENPAKEIISVYKTVIDELPKFQVIAGKDLDYSVCYPRASFDKQSMMWDLNYFKYYFLKLAKINFDEQLLENDFNTFVDFLLQAEDNFFMYRDFQSRNIMLYNHTPYFIDYQGGRKGALQYDIASLLYDAKANLPQAIRDELLNYYIKAASQFVKINEKDFLKYYPGFVLIRILQAMGAYGYRGFYERKEHFLKSIPYAMNNLESLLTSSEFSVKINYLLSVLKKVIVSEELMKYKHTFTDVIDKLKVTITSFSYKKGIPADLSGNGGGFVFDCRGIHNPGRYEQYKALSGKDKDVIEFLEKENDMNEFLKNVYALVDHTIENYLRRDFKNLMVNFGCTGGQHRSVYSAEMLAKHLKAKYDFIIELKHSELPIKADNKS